MQVLYVATFEVRPGLDADASTDCALVALELLGEWIGGLTDPPVSVAELREPGSVNLSPANDNPSRTASWDFVGDQRIWATRVERRDVRADGSVFVTRVTLGTGPSGSSMRVSMAFEVPSGGLTPTQPPAPRQPHLIRSVVKDPRLEIRVDSQVQDGTYLQVRANDEVRVLAAALAESGRLPILLLHTRTLEAIQAAKYVASGLVGLVRVVTLDYKSTRLLNQILPQCDVPYAGGLLVWADVEAPASLVTSGVLNGGDPERLRAELMSRIAPLSVLTRGTDNLFRQARAAERAAQVRAASTRAAEAAHSGDSAEQLKALRAELAATKSQNDDLYEEWSAADQLAMQRASEVAALKSQVLHLEAQVKQFQVIQQFEGSEDHAPTESLDNAPDLVSGDADSLQRLCEHLERSTAGRFQFTPGAITAWRRASRYPTPAQMRDSLIALARLANDIHDESERSIGHFDKWVYKNYGLSVAMQDDGLSRKARRFDLDGETYDRSPHVKVNDGVPVNECGRIYFANDTANRRIIVDHIGLHL